ncbi:MAG: GH36 C-terminal domain-containing protein, partial [Oscillospiraceae bacterium]
KTGEVHSGNVLMNAGIDISAHGDFASEVIYFTKQ